MTMVMMINDLGHHCFCVPWHLSIHQHYFQLLLHESNQWSSLRIFEENLWGGKDINVTAGKLAKATIG